MVIAQEYDICHLKQSRNANSSTDHSMRKYHHYKTKIYTSITTFIPASKFQNQTKNEN